MELRRMFHNIQTKADGLLGEGGDQVIIPTLLPVDARQAEQAFGQHES
jgi:hypothetical protein